MLFKLYRFPASKKQIILQEVQGLWKLISYMKAFMPAEVILRAQVSFILRRAEPGGLDTTFSSINPQTKICPTKLVMQITLFEQKKKFEQRKNLFQKFSYLSTKQLHEQYSIIIYYIICNMIEEVFLFLDLAHFSATIDHCPRLTQDC